MNKMKRNIPNSVISEIFSSHSLGNVSEIKPLSGGEFNSVWKVTAGSSEYVIKIPPSAAAKVLTYEKNIILSECFSTKEFQKISAVHIPRLIAYCTDAAAEYKYILLEFVEGEALSSVKLTNAEYNNVMFDLGKAIAEMHNIKCTSGFGYLQNGLKPTYEIAYMSMIDNIVQDAAIVNAKIPYLNEIKNIIDSYSHILREVSEPVITHFDLWQGNIFIKDKKLYSIIDCERTIFGDPLGDFIHLNFLSPFNIDENKHLIDGYNSVADKKLSFNKNELIRLYLMRIYLGLIAYVESYYRFSKLDAMFYGKRIFAKKFLRVSLNELQKLTS